jgi:hypothetical protein
VPATAPRLGSRARPRIAALAATAAAALALGVAGCGENDASSALDDALGYLPKDAPVVAAVETDPDGEQLQQVDELISRFPFSGQFKEGFKNGVVKGRDLDFEDDVEPLLGNEVVIGVPDVRAGGSDTPAVVAWRVGDAGKAKKVLEDKAEEDGEIDGAEVFKRDDQFTALDDDVLVAADSREMLEEAIDRRHDDDRLTEDDFQDRLGDLSRDGLVRVAGDAQRLLESSPDSAAARSIPWVGALRTFAVVLYASGDGLAVDVNVRTEGVGADQLPLAAGSDSPPVVTRDGEVALAIRDPGRIFDFAKEVNDAAPRKSGPQSDDPSVNEALKRIGVDLKRDVVDQLGAASAASIALDGSYAVRVDLKDPKAFAGTLATVASKLPRAGAPLDELSIEPGGGAGFYRVTGRDGKQAFVGVVGDRLVVGKDAARAREFADAPAQPIAGARGAVAATADLKAIVGRLLSRGGRGPFQAFGQALLSPLKDATGWVEAQPDGLTAHLGVGISGSR